MTGRGLHLRTSAVVFSDVIRELQIIASMAEGADDVAVLTACRRAQSLADRLRHQFLGDLLGDRSPSDQGEQVA